MVPTDETVALLALLGPETTARQAVTLTRRVREAGSATAILRAEQGLFLEDALQIARQQLSGWREEGIDAVSMFDPGYPPALSEVPDSPGLLFLAGSSQYIDPPRSVAIVGSRQASAAGCARASAVAETIASEGYVVVSGLAEGIDTAAHEAALTCAGATIAVLGNGIRQVYPRQNAGLQRRIARNGALVSQFRPDSPPARWTFPARNVLMSALTCATVIVEAGATSGTRVQARAALEQGRLLVLFAGLLEQDWARELAEKPGVVIARGARDVVTSLRTPPLIHAA